MSMSEWSGEILIPAANITGYELVYEAETWLRRICLAAFLLAEGPAWAATLGESLRTRIEERSRENSAHWYLGMDDEEELLWSTTHGELADLLRSKAIATRVEGLCGVDGGFLSERLTSVAKVRNALAHNRAISDDTLTILRGDLTVLRAAAARFKLKTLYAEATSFHFDFADDLAEFGVAFQDASRSFPRQTLFAQANDDFVFLVRLPSSPFDRWPRASSLRQSLKLAGHLLLCVLANKAGDELQLVFPRSLPDADKLEVLRHFMAKEMLETGWTDLPLEEQHPADVCWPRLWFYENRTPDRR